MTKLFITPFVAFILQGQILIPVLLGDRHDITTIKLTEIGEFGLLRKARVDIPEHYHTGIDIKRPGKNYESEPIFPVAKGLVISNRTDGPYANLIIEHVINGQKIWTLYEHISGIRVKVGDIVDLNSPVARFMNKAELNKYGWQFDHFHLEIIKVMPIRTNPSRENPERFYNSYSLICYTRSDLQKYYFDPVSFLKANF
jgi:hypothetical protein